MSEKNQEVNQETGKDQDPNESKNQDSQNNAENARIRVALKEKENSLKDLQAKLDALEKEKSDREEAELGEVDRLKKENETLNTQLQSAKAGLDKLGKESALKDLLVKEGCVHIEDAVKLADLTKINPSDKDSIKDFAKAFKEDKPFLFQEAKLADMKTTGKEPDAASGKETQKKEAMEEAKKNKDPLAALKAMR